MPSVSSSKLAVVIDFSVTSSMEKDEGDATMEALDATKKLNLVDVNEPVQVDAAKREQEEVTNENVPSSSTTDNELNRIDEKVIQETLTEDTGKCVFCHFIVCRSFIYGL